MTSTPHRRRPIRYAWLLVLSGSLGLLAAFIITLEKLRLLADSSYVPSCSLNPIISCGSVMETAQASVFGFPNSWLGLIGFAIIITVGMSLLAGATFADWYWRVLNLAALLGVIFVHWLFFQSVYVIEALCPWCMLVWVVTIATFWYTTMRNIHQGIIPVTSSLEPVVAWIKSYKNLILALWYLAITALILQHFWYYFKTLL